MKIKIIDAVFISLSIINVIFSAIRNVDYICYLLFVFIIILRLGKNFSNEEFLLYILFVPSKYLQLLAVILYLIFTGELLKNRCSKKNFIVLSYIIVFGVVNCVIYKGFIISTLFQFGVYYCIFRMINSFDNNININITFDIFNKFFYLQIISVLIQVYVSGKFGDFMRGTLISAHYLAVFLLIYMYMICKFKDIRITLSMRIINFIIAIIILLLSDAKHVVVIILFSYFMSKLLDKAMIKNKITIFGIILLIGTIFTLCLSQSNIAQNLLSRTIIGTYLFDDNYNKKLLFFLNTMNEMKSWHGLFGFGVGQFGSQISITMAKGIIYEWNTALSGYRFAIEPYKNAISGLMTEWYSTYGIIQSSMVLGYPLVSFVGIIAELGVVGYLMLLRIFDDCYKGKDVTFIIAFLLLTFFDTYLEIPCVFIMILIGNYLIQNSNVNNKI